MKNIVKDHLAQVNTIMKGAHGFSTFFLTYGKEFKVNFRKSFKEKGEKGLCYMNAFNLMHDSSGELTYVEGMASIFGVPLDHAWCVDSNGLVHDPTWNRFTLKGESIKQKDVDYFGVPFKSEFVIDTVVKRGFYGVIDNPQDGFPLLRGLVNKEEFLQRV